MMIKRSGYLLLVLALCVSMCIFVAHASETDAEPGVVAGGACGENATWVLDDTYTLTISGTGKITESPWKEWICTENSSVFYDAVIEAGITEIGAYVFQESSLVSVVIPDSVTTIGEAAFQFCSVLSEVSLGSGLETVGYSAFGHCSSISQITIPASVTKIENFAFQYCTSLARIIFAGEAPQISEYAFKDVSAVAFYPGGESWTDAVLQNYGGEISWRELDIGDHAPDEILASGQCGANVQWSLSYGGVLTLSGEGETYAYLTEYPGWYAYDDAIKEIVVGEGITGLGDFLFYKSESVEKVTLPESLTSWGNKVFTNCGKLQSVVIPDGVTKIGTHTFNKCTSLTEVTLPKNLETIPMWTFGYSGITAVDIPETVTVIGQSAFYNCSALQEIRIPDGVTKIESDAFCDCTALKTVIFEGDCPSSMYYGMFTGCTLTAYYPGSNSTWTESKLNDYGGTVTWQAIGPVIKKQPEYAIVPMGEKATVSVEAEGDGLTYQWYYMDRGANTFSLSPSFTGPTYSVIMTPERSERQLYCVITDNSGYSVQTETVAIFGYTPLQIISQPKTTYTKQGEQAKITVEATGEGLTYQWYIKNAGATKYSKSSVTAATYSVKMSESVKDRLVYCVVTDAFGDTVRTETVRLRMAATVTDQSKTTYTRQGEIAEATVTATGDGLKYQWYVKNAGATKYSKSSITSSTYTCKMNEASKDRLVYCVVTDKYGNTDRTATVRLRMAATVTKQSKTTYTKLGSTAKASVEAVGDGLTYQWYIKNAGATKYSASSITSATYTCKMSEVSKDRLVYCVVTDKYGNTTRSETVRLRMAATITEQPESVTVAEGAQAKVTVTAVGDGLTYTWYYKDAGATAFTKTSSFTGPSYYISMTDARDGRQVYCVVTDKYGKTVKSNTVTLNMQ